MLKIIIHICFLILLNNRVNAQNLVEVLNEKLIVNSQTAMYGSTRNVSEIRLPKGTIGYTYRISVAKRGDNYVNNNLFSLLQNVPVSQLSLGANLAQYAIGRSDGSQIDFFIFTGSQDKDAFASKSNNWNSCRSFLNRVNTCAYIDKCLNETIWFGFRNNNFSQGLDIKLEVVATVDNQSTDQLYSFEIINKASKDMIFELSTDGLTWKPCFLRDSYQGRWQFKQPTVQFRVASTNGQLVKYELRNTERYSIGWNANAQRWDLFNY